MKLLVDQIGFEHRLETSPQRIISLVPSQTELLFDLGLESRIVGITKYCVHPFHFLSTKKIVGGTKKVEISVIKELKPDIIVGNKEENTLEMVQELRKICPVWVTDVKALEDNAQMITDFGRIFNCRTEAQKWNDKIVFALADFNKFIKDKESKKVAYFIWKNPYRVAGAANFINALLKLNHFVNIYEDRVRYPEIELKKIRIEGDPDLVFLPSEPYPFKEEDAFEIGRFTHHAKTIYVDGAMFSWYGSRLLKAFEYFKALHNRIS